MRRLFLAALGVLTIAGIASAQQPQPQAQPQPQPQPQAAPAPSYSPGATAAVPVQANSGTTVIRGSGSCSSCGSTTGGSTRGAYTMSNATGGNCMYGYTCQNGCGSVKSVLAFQFGTCSQFFSPCGPTCGGLWKKCPTTQFMQPYGTGHQCPRVYDSYADH